MCFIQEPYHSMCGHWAKYPEFVPGGKCAIAENVPGWSKGCENAVSYGMATRHSLCPRCVQDGRSNPTSSHSSIFSTPQKQTAASTAFGTPSSVSTSASSTTSSSARNNTQHGTGNGRFDSSAFNHLVRRHDDHFSRRLSVTNIFSFDSNVPDTLTDEDYRPRQDSMFSVAEEDRKQTATKIALEPSIPHSHSPPISPNIAPIERVTSNDLEFLIPLPG